MLTDKKRHGGARAGAGRPSLKDEDYNLDGPQLDVMGPQVVVVRAGEYRVPRGSDHERVKAQRLVAACKACGIEVELREVSSSGTERIRYDHVRITRDSVVDTVEAFGQGGGTVAQLAERLFKPARVEPEDWGVTDRRAAVSKTYVWVTRLGSSVVKARCPNTGKVLLKSPRFA